MIIEWIVGGLVAGAAVAIIVTYWNEIVSWVKDTFKKFFQRGMLVMKFVGGKLISKIMGILNDGRAGGCDGPDKPASEEDIWELWRNGVITTEERDALLRGESIRRGL